MLSVFADNVGEKGNRLRPGCFAENNFDKTNYNCRKAVFYIYLLDLQVTETIKLVHCNNLGVFAESTFNREFTIVEILFSIFKFDLQACKNLLNQPHARD